MKKIFWLFLLTFLVSCGGDDEIKEEKGKGTITLNVNYAGTKVVKQIKVAILTKDENPVQSMPPYKFKMPENSVETGITFPQNGSQTELPDGNYWVTVYGDTDLTDGMLPSDVDPQKYLGPLTIKDGNTVTQEVLIEDKQ